VIDYILERNVPLKSLQLEAANLITNEKWVEFFEHCGDRLESLKLSWLDYALDDNTFMHLIQNCPKLKRLKIKKCFRLGDPSLGAILELKHLEHLSLRFPSPTSSATLVDLVASVGPHLRTLSLENFYDAEDNVLRTIHLTCVCLDKLRFTENDICTDAGFVSLFTGWRNPPLTFIDFSSNRSVDYSKPDGPEEPTGLAAAGFLALMNHSGSVLEHLDISSCRHITYQAFLEVFDGKKQYPNLKDINISFLTKIDITIVAGIFKSCPQLSKLTAFGCFSITGISVPKDVALIGAPNAQDSILQEGAFGAEMGAGLPPASA
jgi:DNA repair protein RAD7